MFPFPMLLYKNIMKNLVYFWFKTFKNGYYFADNVGGVTI